MSDLTDRQAAIDALGERPMVWTDSDYELGQRNQYDSDKVHLELVPSVEERKKGKWELQEDIFSWEGIFDGYFCSECGKGFLNDLCCNNGTDWFDVKKDFKFCPFCGADMRGGQDE